MICDVAIYAGETPSTTIVLYVPLNVTFQAPTAQETTVFLYANPVQAMANADSTDIIVSQTIPGAAAPAVGVFPPIPEVKLGTIYGPNNNDYTGTYNPMAAAVFPIVGDVRTAITYGPTGAEYTGTYAAAVLPSTLFEISQGKLVKVIGTKYALLLV